MTRPRKIFINFPEGIPERCIFCEDLGVEDSSNVYVMCNECMDWKEKLQEKPGFGN